MTKTYEALIEGETLTWIGDRPVVDGKAHVRMKMDFISGQPESNGARLARMIDEYIARIGGLTSIEDPVAWQREQRIDRPMPGRY